MKDCVHCKNLVQQRKGGMVIGLSCVGQAGKKWAPSVAQADARCGPKRTWFVARAAVAQLDKQEKQ
jgi:hypothetical protein